MGELGKEAVSAIAFEMMLMVFASVAAFVEAWGVFAAIAFWCVMLPIWIIAISLAAHHFIPRASQEDKV